MSFEIITDGSAEFYEGFIEKNPIIVLPSIIDENGYHAISPKTAHETIDGILEQGKDVLYIGMSSKLSHSFENVAYICKGLRIKYKDRKIEFIDSLSSSCALGLMIYYALKEQKAGKSIEEVTSFIESIKLKFRGIFILDNPSDSEVLNYSNAQNSAIDIRPIFGINREGNLAVITKIIGRKKAFLEMLKILRQTCDKNYSDIIAIEYIDQKIEAENFKIRIKDIVPTAEIVLIKANEFVAKQLASPGIGITFVEK